LWVNLPPEQKMTAPKYQDLRASGVGLATSSDGAALVRVIAGELPTTDGTVTGPGSTNTPMAMTHVTVPAGSRVDLPWPKDFNALVYVMSGRGTVGGVGQPIQAGQAAVLGGGQFVSLAAETRQDASTPDLEVIVLGGRPIGEPIAWAGPFVMNTRAELATAMDDYRKGRFGNIPAL
jgi:redox-sensitive bicupin YhaK (pirin superfamily)